MGYADEVLADSPYSWFTLGEASGTTVTNSGSNTQTGTYNGAVTLGVPGIPGSTETAATFDGSLNSTVTLPYDGLYVPTVGRAVAFEMWYKGTDAGSNAAGGTVGTTAGLLSMSTSSTNKRWVFGIDADGKVRLYTHDTYVLTGPTSAVVNDGQWHHIVVKISADPGYDTEIWVDGVLDIASTLNVDNGSGTPSFVIADNVRAVDGETAGTFAHVATYFGETDALSPTRIAAHYQAGIAVPLLSQGWGLRTPLTPPSLNITVPYSTNGYNGLYAHCRTNGITLNTSQRTTLNASTTSEKGVDGGASTTPVHTQNESGSWWTCGPVNYRIKPTRVQVLGRQDDTYALLRNWSLEGSQDGLAWTTLASTAGGPSQGTWFGINILTDTEWRFLRVIQTGTNASGDHYLTLGEVEVYGTMTPDSA